ncbi:hypothetical protein [Myxococcus eversor]|uniref:hypothetical protein n=1 Tax=Myxococcus eversor TaxID=2709661 RepID=UPI0013D639C0|nr:hypothetical protein [Myxococcus eversor]
MARRSRPTSFPHPVVGIGDDIAGQLLCNAPDFDFGADTTVVLVDGLVVTNQTIAGLVRDQKAAFTVRVGCGATYYRETFRTHEARLRLTLPSATLVGDVEVQVRVCALQRIEQYGPVQLHPDYGDRTFDVQAGDVLALGADYALRVEKQFDPLAADIPSIMRLQKGKHLSGPFEVNFGGEQIILILSAEDYENYGIASRNEPELVHAALVMPVLCEAIRIIRRRADEDEMMTGLNWFRRLAAMMDARRIDENDEVLTAAQKLLDMPLSRAFKSVARKSEEA